MPRSVDQREGSDPTRQPGTNSMATVPVQKSPTPEPPNGHGATRPGEPPRLADTRTADWSDDVGKRRLSAWRVPISEHLQWLQADLDDRDSRPPAGVLAA